jgi:hypothetical protein
LLEAAEEPERVLALSELRPLNTFEAHEIRYFSGTATYRMTFELPQKIDDVFALDVGQVGDIAEVQVNGKNVGTCWHAPCRIELADAIRTGSNSLEIKVTNLWVNRLIGEAQPGAKRITKMDRPPYRKDAPLRPAGLIGPVTLLGGG